MGTVKQTNKKAQSIKKEVADKPSNIIELTELEKEKFGQLQKLNEEYSQICAQAGAKEVELAVVQESLEDLKNKAKQAYLNFINYQNHLNNEIHQKYGNLKQNENGQLERVD